MMQLNDVLVPFLKEWEGCKLTAYTDQGGRVTIGYGHTGNVQLGTVWSEQQADEALAADISGVVGQVESLVKVPVNVNQMAALCSFTYNLGASNLAKSGLLKLLNRSQFASASEQFPLWNHIGMYVSPGLTKRRDAEKALFLKDPNEAL
jgi:lysozyme